MNGHASGVAVVLLVVLTQLCAAQGSTPAGPHSLDPGIQALGSEFFAWRAKTQPCSSDDIPRVERPAGWVPDWSPGALQSIRDAYARFVHHLHALPRTHWSRVDSVDFLLLRSAIERVHWEMDILRSPHRDPDFYVQQTLGAVYELLLVSSPMSEERAQEIILRLQSIPETALHARRNLTSPVRPFAATALGNLADVRTRLEKMARGLKTVFPSRLHAPLDIQTGRAADALESYAAWLRSDIERMSPQFSVGPDAYRYYLRVIALNPLSPEAMLVMGRTEYDRAVACEILERQKNASLPEPEIFTSIGAQIEQCRLDELAIREFLERRDLLTVPAWVRHYGNLPTPAWIEPLSHMGVVDDLTSETRISENGYAYIPPPQPGMSYFRKASAQDPRPIIIHEGIPGHYFQMVLSWTHEDPIRRRYFDSGPNEGWGFYVEEMLLQAGLFDQDRPRTREIIYNFMRLRALRVEVDIQLATGAYTIQQAGEYLARMVPMDRETADDEAAFFAAGPGQAITYQIGKLQVLRFLRDARLSQGPAFHVRAFHDYLARNGNVPIALLRWEYLGLRDEVPLLWPAEQDR